MLNWGSVRSEHEEITKKLADQLLDHKKRRELQKKAAKYTDLLIAHDEIKRLEKFIEVNQRQVEKETGELRVLFEEEVLQAQQKLKKVKISLEELLYPTDERDKKSVFLEIRAGTGGQEAALFVADLFRMYSNYALSKNWSVSIVDSNSTDIGGYKELIVHIKGKGVYRYFKFESGVHRVQRVPQTETAGRVHTSTVTVAVMPEADDVEVEINPQDLRIDVFRAQGAGGQHVNTTDSAVRIVHIPTGVVVTCQDERSQIKNKARAMKVLKSRLLDAETRKRETEIREKRKQQIGTGDRSEKIRTYNFPQNRVTDHRINLTLKKLDIIMQGNMNDLIDPLFAWDLTERKKKGI